jgi:hypothetical protein
MTQINSRTEKYEDPLLRGIEDVPFEVGEKLIFIVYKQGWFGQGTHGISFDQIEAEEIADKASRRDRDEHHCYDVYAVPLGKLPPQGGNEKADFGWMNRAPVYSTSKTMYT